MNNAISTTNDVMVNPAEVPNLPINIDLVSINDFNDIAPDVAVDLPEICTNIEDIAMPELIGQPVHWK